ncbi:hypothetical protein G4B88_029501, partial [Cannabis sativa]
MWNDDWEVSVKSFSVGHIDALVQCPGRRLWRFTGFYGNPKASSRSDSWRLLCRLKDLFALPWICGGDFNEILSISEKKGGADRSLSAMAEFQQALDKCSLVDMGYDGQCFTWLNKRQGAAHVQERLDRFCCNQDWHELFPSGNVCTGDFIHSDHRPVVATLENVVRVQKKDKKRGFRFETHWLKDEECHDIVHQSWAAQDGPLESQESIIDIFGRCADRLGTWNKNKFGSIPKLLLNSGMRKVVGDGRSVNAFRDPWVPRPRSFRPISPAPTEGLMVSDFIGMDGAWDIPALSQYFL